MSSRTLRRALVLSAGLLYGAAAAACAQQNAPPGDASRAAAQADSVLPRAQRDRIRGSEHAPVTLVEISDFQCPYCRQFATTTYRQLDSAYIRPGRVRMVFINLPLSNHTNAYAAAEAAMCAGAQGQFWPMHDRLFASQAEWSTARDPARQLQRYAQALPLDTAVFRDCVENDRTAALIVGDAMDAARGGVSGTPSFIIVGPGGRRSLGGAPDWATLQREVELALSGAAPQQPPTPRN